MAKPTPIQTGIPTVPALVAANAPLMSTTYVSFANGTIVLAIACNPSATLQIVRNGVSYALNAAGGGALTAASEYDISLPVADAETINFSFSAGTTLTLFEPFFSEDI